MVKPKTSDGYDPAVTELCERVLVTLLRGLGPWKGSMYIVGGLVPRYLVTDRPPFIPPHAGTGDIDLVIRLEMLAETEAYNTLEENLKKIGFKPRLNKNGNVDKWGWLLKEGKTVVVLELLADNPKVAGGKVKALPTETAISALNIPHASIVFDEHETREVTVELLSEGGKATEKIRYANLVSFVCLKALAYDDRHERKDAHDLVYCLEFAPGGVDAAVEKFKTALKGKHAATVKEALDVLRRRFATDKTADGYAKDGCVSAARFEFGDDPATKDACILKQRDVAALIEEFLQKIGS